MRAYVLEKYGAAMGCRILDVPKPIPGHGEILVRVRAVGLNPVDFKIRQGKLRPVLRLKLPLVMGNELAGEIVDTGPAVKRFKRGDQVFARVEKERLGAFAEFALVHESCAARAPSPIDMTRAAAVPLAGLTALQALRDELKVAPGHKVLITGGAGGVGTFAIQIAKWLGAHVTTTASARGDALVRSLGADQVIDYTTQDLGKVRSDIDAGFDLVGGETLERMFQVMKRGSSIVSVAGVPEPQMALKDLGGRRMLAALFWAISYQVRAKAQRAGVSYRYLFMRPSGADLELLTGLIEQGHLKIIVDRVFKFSEIGEALAYVESGRAKGKVVVSME